MVIGKKHEPSLTSVDINGHTINTTEELKLLVVTIDKELRYLGPYLLSKLLSKLGHSDRKMLTLTSFVSNIRTKDLANLVSNYVCTGNCPKCV